MPSCIPNFVPSEVKIEYKPAYPPEVVDLLQTFYEWLLSLPSEDSYVDIQSSDESVSNEEFDILLDTICNCR